VIRGAGFEQPARIGLMARQICALIDDAVVPVQSKPLQPVEDRAGALVGTPRFVGVFNAEQELAVELPGVQPVEECRARAADVEISGRRRGEA
jgi:hypothetical protein